MGAVNQAAFMTAVKTIEIRDVPMPVQGDGDVLLRLSHVGICGSDAHFFTSGQRKGQAFRLPFILGHECSGTVEAVGKNVSSPAVGDRVVFEPQITCGRCEYCRSGRYNLCPGVVFPSTPPYDGMLRRYAVIPAHLAFRLPDGVDLAAGALVEPLAVGLSAAARGGAGLGMTVVILGGGCIGLMTLLACKAMGASRIFVSDVLAAKGEKAVMLGAECFIDASRCDVAAAVADLTGGKGADIVFETAGNGRATASTPSLVKRGGVIVLVGNVNGDTPFPFMDLMYKEAAIRTIYRYRNNFPLALEAVAGGAVDLGSLISHRFPFEQTHDAFMRCVTHPQEVVKAVIEF